MKPATVGEQSEMERIQVIGAVSFLSIFDKTYRTKRMNHLTDRVNKAFSTGKFRVFVAKNFGPIAYVSWVNSSSNEFREYLLTAPLPDAKNFQANELFCTDFIAIPEYRERVLSLAFTEVFQGMSAVHVLEWDNDEVSSHMLVNS